VPPYESDRYAEHVQFPHFPSATVATSPPVRKRSIAMSLSVCLSVCPPAFIRNYRSNLHQIIMHVIFASSGLTLLVERQEEHPACKN